MTPAELAQAADCTPGPIQELRRKKLVTAEVRRVQQTHAGTAHGGPRPSS